MRCNECGQYEGDNSSNFCKKCGAKFQKENKLPCIGKFKETGIYRITFAPVEDEFSADDSANDAARHSSWFEDREFDDYEIEFVKSTVTRATHPYICNNCHQHVSEHTEGRCGDCGEQNWIQRTDETEKIEELDNDRVEKDVNAKRITMSYNEFAKMIEDYEGVFLECSHIDEKGNLCKYHKQLGGKTYTLNKKMILALLSDGEEKEIPINCDYCSLHTVIVVKPSVVQ